MSPVKPVALLTLLAAVAGCKPLPCGCEIHEPEPEQPGEPHDAKRDGSAKG